MDFGESPGEIACAEAASCVSEQEALCGAPQQL